MNTGAAVGPVEEREGGAAGDGRRVQVLLGVGVALALVVGAWFLAGGSAGLAGLGTGGVNQRLLPKVGQPAPDFATHDLLGRTVNLSDYRGRPVWLMFWGSWCPPCRAEFPDVQRAYQQLEPEGVALLGVSLDEPPLAAAEYAMRNGATFTVLSDPGRSDTGGAYPILNFPTHIFIDADGVVRSIVLEDMSEERALREAGALLPGGEGASS